MLIYCKTKRDRNYYCTNHANNKASGFPFGAGDVIITVKLEKCHLKKEKKFD